MATAARILIGLAIVLIGLACGGFVIEADLLRGHVLRSDGSPVAAVVMRWWWLEDPRRELHEVRTDAKGEYRIWVLEPGRDVGDWRHIAVEPLLDGYTFVPAVVERVLTHEEQVADFVATASAGVTAGAVHVGVCIWVSEAGSGVTECAVIERLSER